MTYTHVNVLRGLGSQHITPIEVLNKMFILRYVLKKCVMIAKTVLIQIHQSNLVAVSRITTPDRSNCGPYDAMQHFFLNLVMYCLIILENIQRDKQDLTRPVANDSFEEESMIGVQSPCYYITSIHIID